MSTDARPPSAIRITRPYASEEEFLQHELETLSRTSITLIGAQPRAEGVVLRFELVLQTGQALVRGEGRVVGYKTNAHSGQGGLSLRFTRLDVRSKALIDKAAAMREQRRPASLVPPPAAAPAQRPSVPPPPTAFPPLTTFPAMSGLPPLPTPRQSVPPPLPPRASTPPPPPVGRRSVPPPPVAPLPLAPPLADGSIDVSFDAVVASPAVRAVADAPARPAGRSLDAPPQRDELLARLRARGRALAPEAVQEILRSSRSQAG